ncbi:transposase [Acetobacter malorum DSM 14337]|uniref:Transposase n=1 Tax=Acetobacter malorum DSM 14337 TaxID=1307910 RepID=A0ABQ0PUD2_9PROT|nr:transposase [Acetobacter malorum DSM 14337]
MTVDYEVFRPDLDKTVAYTDGSKGSHPHLWCDLMFKILMIQMLNIFSDKRTEYLLNDYLSFIRFLALDLSDRLPDAKTIRLFRELLTQAGEIERLFERFNATLRNAGYLPMSGQILNATLVTTPKQRNTNGEQADLRAGRPPQDWQDKPAKLPRKDRRARRALKFAKAKQHIKSQ